MSAQSAPERNDALRTILPQLQRTQGDDRPIVVMTCGIAGAGKSTLAKSIVANLPHFVRLSADKFVYETYGLFGIDYPKDKDKYSTYLDQGQVYIKDELARLLETKERDVVLDLSFWNKAYRDEYKGIIEKHGGRWVLVFLDAERATLETRIAGRRAARDGLALDDGGRNGDSAYDIDGETFDMYWNGFERPHEEGEIIIKVT